MTRCQRIHVLCLFIMSFMLCRLCQNGLPINYSSMTHLWILKPDSTELCIDFVSGNGLPWAIYFEIWEDLLSNHATKKERKRKNRDTEDQFSQTDTYWSSGLFCCRCFSLPFWLIKFSLILMLWSASAVRYVMHIQRSLNQTHGWMCSCKQAGGLVAEESSSLSKVNPTPTIVRARCHMKVCTKLNGC